MGINSRIMKFIKKTIQVHISLSLVAVLGLLFLPVQVSAQECANVEGTGLFGTLVGGAWQVTSDVYTGERSTEQISKAIDGVLCNPAPRIRIPGLIFTSAEDIAKNTFKDESDNIYVSIPFLGEYIAAVYQYAVAFVSIIAVIIIIISGIQWSSSAGDSTIIQGAKKRIEQAIIGLVLIIFTYVILFTINPNLTRFNAISLLFVQGDALEHVTYFPEDLYSQITGGKRLLKSDELDKMARDAAQAVGIDECIVIAIMAGESGGAANAIGHDENVQNCDISARREFLQCGTSYSDYLRTGKECEAITFPATECSDSISIKNNDGPIHVDEMSITPPDYGLDWRFGHGIGLMQIQVFKDEYCSGGERGRNINGTCYTIPDLLDPQKNINAAAEYIKSRWDYAGAQGLTGEGRIMGTFRSYNAGSLAGLRTPAELSRNIYVIRAMKHYRECTP